MALIAWYKLDGDAKNNTGDGSLDGTATNVSWVDGKIGKCGSFLSNGERIIVPSISNNILTFSFWYKWEPTLTSWRTIIGRDSNHHHVIFDSIGRLSLWDEGGQRTYGYTVTDNNWHHYVVTIESALKAFAYVDGNYIGETIITLNLSTYSVQNIGNWGTGSYPCGYLDDVKIYDRELSDSEIRRLALVDNRALVGHWPLVGDAEDISGFNNHGTPTNITYTPALFGSGATFNGSNSISCGNNPILSPKSITVAGWIKLNTSSSWMLIDRGMGNTNGAYYLYADNPTTATFAIFGPTGARYDVGTAGPGIGSWVHYAASFDHISKIMKIYRNGVFVNYRNNADFGTSESGSYIGQYSNSGGYRFNGQAQDIRIYNYALSDDEIAKLAQPKILHYKFDDRTEEATHNLLNNGNNPTFSGLTVLLDVSNLENGRYLIKAKGLIPPYTFGSFRINMPYNVLVDGKTYNLSLKYKIIEGNPDFKYADWCDGDVQRYSEDRVEYILESGYGSRSTYTSTFRFMDCSINPNSTIEIWDLQLEQKDHDTPFTPTTREGAIIKDSSLSKNDGVVNLTYAPIWKNGKISYGSMDFSDLKRVSFTNPLDQDNLNQEWTVSAWVFLYGGTTRQNLIKGWNRGITLGTDGTQPLLYLNSGANDYYTYGQTLPSNEWIFVSFVFRNSDGYRKIFMNGVDITTSGPNKTSIPSGISNPEIGTNLNGQLDDFRIYAKALTDSEIQEIYNERSGQLRFGSDKTKKITMGGSGPLTIN